MHQRNVAPRGVVVAGLVLALGASVAAPAVAEPDNFTVPSREQVRTAETEAALRAAAVGAIKAQLLMANQRLEQAATGAEQASEAYNGARWALAQAKVAARKARQDAARARRTVAEQRDAIGGLVATSYQQGAELSALNAVVSADGPEAVLDQYAAFQGASTSLQADYERFAATDALAQVFEEEALEAEREQVRVAAWAQSARLQAAQAVAQAQVVAGDIAADKERLIVSLAAAQNISVQLARTRQTALEEAARQRAAEQAQREAVASARAEERARARAEEASNRAYGAATAAIPVAPEPEPEPIPNPPASPRPTPEPAPKQQPAPAPAPAPEPQPTPRPAPTPPPAPAPVPTPTPVPAPGPAEGAQRAVDFAVAQVGEPYRWGAAGPDAWDCSGLTMRAWQQGGTSLPHYSVAQYDSGTPVTADELRAGDLVFWSSSGSPGGIHHVALYMGDGMIVHAPRTGRSVAVESMYYWVPPTHFVRP